MLQRAFGLTVEVSMWLCSVGCCCEGAIVRVHVVLCMMLQWDSVALYHAYNMQDQQVCPLPCNL